MADSFDINGLQTKTLSELLADLTTGWQGIYGSDITLDANSPDGQLEHLIAQVGIDLRELLQLVNANFDPDQAEGITLDQRVGINGIARLGGTFSTVSVSVTIAGSVSLIGLDADINNLAPNIPTGCFTVQDSAGNQAFLQSSTTLSAGTTSLVFRAAAIGQVIFAANTLDTVVSILAGISAVNNPAGNLTTGENMETDTALKIRRRQSLTLPSTGLLDGLEAFFKNSVTGVTDAIVYENATDSVDIYGNPAHSIWCIVEGGTDADIAQAIYSHKTMGCPMVGTKTHAVTRPNSQTFTAKWDVPNDVGLWIQFTLAFPGGVIDSTYIKNYIATNLQYALNQDAVFDDVSFLLKSLNPLYRISAGLLSINNFSTSSEIITSASVKDKFVLSSTRIYVL